jgi:hypothetical protein
MLRQLLLLVVLGCWVGYSYSESIAPYYGTTPNAASGGNTWSMDNVLPSGVPGLDINLVIYDYTPIKETQDEMKVHIQNKNADGTGYIFRETDDWTGVQGGIGIRKVVPVTPLNRSNWGDGSIEVEGTGTVDNASVIYNYRVDPCYNPQYDPNCPGYQQPELPEIETVDIDSLYDPLEDDTVKNATASTDTEQYDEDDETRSDDELAKEEDEEEKDREERLEKALAAAQNAVLFSEALAQSQMLDAMNMAINMNSYYAASIDGGVYQESVTLVDKEIPDNKQGLRNGFAQQLLHEEMIQMQYK